MEVFETLSEMGHEQVILCHGKNPDIKAIIAIHNTTLGPAMGATRLFPYVNESAALKDALRLRVRGTYALRNKIHFCLLPTSNRAPLPSHLEYNQGVSNGKKYFRNVCLYRNLPRECL